MSKEYDFLSFSLGDVIWLIEDGTDIQEQQRIVGLKIYPDEPERSSFTLANKVLTFDELAAKYDDAASTVDNITSDNGTVSGSSIDSIQSDQISDLDSGIQNSAAFGSLSADILEARELIATQITAVRGEFGSIIANSGTFEELSSKIFETEKATIQSLFATDISAANASINTLESNYANIVHLLAGNASVGDLTNIHLTTANAVIDSALIRNAVMESVTVNDLLAGTIDTSKFRIASSDGTMVIEGATQQYYDEDGHLRLQIGKDATGDFNYIVYTKDGKGQLFNADGITASAIGDGLIVNNMVADNAAISGSKLDIASVIRSINGSTESIDMSRIWYDEGNQSMNQLYSQMSTTLTNVSADAANAVANSERALQALDGITTVDALAASLSNEIHVIHTDYEGNGGVFTNAKTTVSVFKGDADVSNSATITVTPGDGIIGSWDEQTRTYQVTGMTVDDGYVDFNITYGNNAPHVLKRFSLSKSYDGKAGYAYDLITDPSIIRKAGDGSLVPEFITISALCYKGETSVAYVGIIVIDISEDGINYVESYKSATAEAIKDYDVPYYVRAIRISLVDPLTNALLSVKSVIVIEDAESIRDEFVSISSEVAKIRTSIKGLNVDLSNMQSELHGITNGTLIHQVLRTDSVENAIFTHVLHNMAGQDVTSEYDKDQFKWYMRDEDHAQEYFKATGYELTLPLSDIGYGAYVIGKFTSDDDDELVVEVPVFNYDIVAAKFETHDTQFNVVQGKISALISDSEITTLVNGGKTMYSRLVSAEANIDGITTQVSNMNKDNTGIKSRLSTVEQTATGLTTKVSSLETNGVTKSNIASVINQTSNAINISVFKNNSNYATQTYVNSQITTTADSITTQVSNNYATKSEVKQTADGLTVTIGKKLNTADFKTTLVANASSVRLTTGTLSWKSSYSSLSSDGKLVCTSADISGKVTAKSGNIGGWTISDTRIYSETSNYYTAVCTATSDTAYIFWCRKKSNQSDPFYVRADGYMHAENADIKGKIQSNSGTIGGWTISTDGIYRTVGDYTPRLRAGSNTTDAAFRVRTSAGVNTFYIRNDGYLYAAAGEFKGKLTANSGAIGGLTITSLRLYRDLGNYRMFIQGPRNDEDYHTVAETMYFSAQIKNSSGNYDVVANITGAGRAAFRNTTIWGELGISDLSSQTRMVTISTAGKITCKTLQVNGTKNRIVEVDGKYREMYSFEGTAPMFFDCGLAKTDENGFCRVFLDRVFLETIVKPENEQSYFVFITGIDQAGSFYATEFHDSFDVYGSPNTSFTWMAMAKQRDYQNYYMLESECEIGMKQEVQKAQ